MDNENACHDHCASCFYMFCLVRLEHCSVIDCPNKCGFRLHSCKLNDHINIICPKAMVPCINKTIGCPHILQRQYTGLHLLTCPASIVHCTYQWNRRARVLNEKRPCLSQHNVLIQPLLFSLSKHGITIAKPAPSNEQLDKFHVDHFDLALAARDQSVIEASMHVPDRTFKALRNSLNQLHPALPMTSPLCQRTGIDSPTQPTYGSPQKQQPLFLCQTIASASNTCVESPYKCNLNIVSPLQTSDNNSFENNLDLPENADLNESLVSSSYYSADGLDNSLNKNSWTSLSNDCHDSLREVGVNEGSFCKSDERASGKALNIVPTTLIPSTSQGATSTRSNQMFVISDRFTCSPQLHSGDSCLTAAFDSDAIGSAEDNETDTDKNSSLGRSTKPTLLERRTPLLKSLFWAIRDRSLQVDCSVEFDPPFHIKPYAMYMFTCTQNIPRASYGAHFLYHCDAYAQVDGWLEQRCPLAYRGCPFSVVRLRPNRTDCRLAYNPAFSSFTIQHIQPLTGDDKLQTTIVDPYQMDGDNILNRLPNEVLTRIANYLDGLSLTCLSRVSQRFYEICQSLLSKRGVITPIWSRLICKPTGLITWRITDLIWSFPCHPDSVRKWCFSEGLCVSTQISNHLKTCSYYDENRAVAPFCIHRSQEDIITGRAPANTLL